MTEKVSENALERPSRGKPSKGMEIRLQTIERMKRALKEGGELWAFSNSSNAWKNRCGRAGFAVVKDCEVVEYIVTMMN